MLIVTGYVQVDPSVLSQFYSEIGALATVTRLRPGNISYDVGVDELEAGRLLVVERWRDQLSLSDHLAAADTVEFIDRWRDRIRGDIRKYDASNERGVMDG